MAHYKKRHGPAPVPPGNQPAAGPPAQNIGGEQAHAGGGAPFQEQDANRRLGDYETAGEHSIQQPSRINDGQQHSR